MFHSTFSTFRNNEIFHKCPIYLIEFSQLTKNRLDRRTTCYCSETDKARGVLDPCNTHFLNKNCLVRGKFHKLQ